MGTAEVLSDGSAERSAGLRLCDHRTGSEMGAPARALCGVLTGVGHFELPRGVPDRHRAEGLCTCCTALGALSGTDCFFSGAGLAAASQASGGKHYVTSSECWARCSFDGYLFCCSLETISV